MIRNVVRLLALVPVVVLTLLAGTAQAANPVFNNMPADNEFLTGRNVTSGETAFHDPVNAEANQEVEVAVYYHNAVVDTTAMGVWIKAHLPSVAATSHRITAELGADNADTVTGTFVNGGEKGAPGLTINSSTATTLKFKEGSVRWFPDQRPLSGDALPLPNGQNGNTIVTSGISLGNIQGCFQFSGVVLFRVTLVGETVTPPPVEEKAVLDVVKEVRLAGSNDWRRTNQVNSGEALEYRITVRALEGYGTAKNVRLADALPADVSYAGPTYLSRDGGSATQVADTIHTDGLLIAEKLEPGKYVQVTFKVTTAAGILSGECRDNFATVTGENLLENPAPSKAKTCFVAPPPTATPTPVPSATPTPKPVTKQPELPKTGPEAGMVAFLGLTSASGGLGRYLYLKRQVQKSARSIEIL